LEKDLAIQVERDIDEQGSIDFFFVCSLVCKPLRRQGVAGCNQHRAKDQINPVTYETFEVIMNLLGKDYQYFDVVRRVTGALVES
jgi:hypothetical protein